MSIEIQEIEARRCCVQRHEHGIDKIDETRRPMYQHMIAMELVGGASFIRFDEGYGDDAPVDVLIGATCNFDGDEVVTVEELLPGRYAVRDYDGPMSGLADARKQFLAELKEDGYVTVGRLLQVHLMDEIDGETEQQFQIRLAD